MPCVCRSPKPVWSITKKLYLCTICLQQVEAIKENYRVPDVLSDPKIKYKPKWYAYRCPQCDRYECYFPQERIPEGSARCQLCAYIARAEEIIKITEEYEHSYQEGKRNPMDRTLSYVSGKYGKKPPPPEC